MCSSCQPSHIPDFFDPVKDLMPGAIFRYLICSYLKKFNEVPQLLTTDEYYIRLKKNKEL